MTAVELRVSHSITTKTELCLVSNNKQEAEIASTKPTNAERLMSLTRREREVLDLMLSGKTNKESARILGISYRTVDVHRGAITLKMETNALPKLYLCLNGNHPLMTAAYQIDPTDARARINRLSPREYEVAERVISGHPTTEIAEIFDISPRTIDVHRAKVLDKTETHRKHINDQTEAPPALGLLQLFWATHLDLAQQATLSGSIKPPFPPTRDRAWKPKPHLSLASAL